MRTRSQTTVETKNLSSGPAKKDERRCFEQFISTSSAENFDLKLRWNLKFALRARHLKRVEETASDYIKCVIFTVKISNNPFLIDFLNFGKFHFLSFFCPWKLENDIINDNFQFFWKQIHFSASKMHKEFKFEINLVCWKKFAGFKVLT